jgi:hypothetical protein
MVKLTTILCFVVFSYCVNAQQKQDINTRINKVDSSTQPFKSKSNSGHVSKSELNQPVTISKKAGEAQVVHDNTYYQNEIAKIDNHINAINTKIAYVNNDPVEKSNAIASGWFDEMELYKTKLNTQKQLLQGKLTK